MSPVQIVILTYWRVVAPASGRLARGRLALGAAGEDARRTAAGTAALQHDQWLLTALFALPLGPAFFHTLPRAPQRERIRWNILCDATGGRNVRSLANFYRRDQG